MKDRLLKMISFAFVVLITVSITNVKAASTLVHIDYPTVNQEFQNTLRVMGWVMSTENTTIKAYVDNVEVPDIPRQARPDVLKAIKGYGDISTNPTPGFDKYFDISAFCYGGHNFRVDVYDSNNNIIKTEKTTFRKQAPKTKVNIDMPTPTKEYTNTLRIMGWVMSTENTTIKAYVDNVEVPDIPRQARPDVIKAIKGYGDTSTNPTPGFDKYFDISPFCYGGHNFRVDVYDSKNNLIHSEKTTFVKKAPKTKVNIDMPTPSKEYTDTIRIMGWVMSTTNTYIKAYVDNVEVTDIPRQARSDVINAIKGYGDISTNPTPGFDKYFDITRFSYGGHNFRVDVYDTKNNLIHSEKTTFKRIKSKSDLCIDYPKGSESIENNVTISGWYLRSNNYTTPKIFIDNQEISTINFTDRTDVLNNISGYSRTYNTNNGFNTTVDLKTYKYGLHTIKVQLVDNNGVVVNEKTRQFTRKKPQSKINIDYPTSSSNRNLRLMGWYLTKYDNTKVQLFIDGVEISGYSVEKRQDVLNAYPEYTSYMSNSNPGFNGYYDMSSYKDGNHTLTVKIINLDNNDVISSQTKTFKLTKYKGKLNIDTPYLSNVSSNITVSGWEMSESPNSYIKIYVDSYDLSMNIQRSARQDVIDAISGYGDISVNPTPGFSTTLYTSTWVEGAHVLKVELYSQLNELLAVETKNLFLYRSIFNGIDISSHNSVYSWPAVRGAGIDYMFARVAVRGYGINNQGIDGNLVADSAFNSHVNGANSVGIKSGAYVFTQATNSIEAVAEANLALQKVYAVGGKSKIQLPIVYDVEFSGCYENGNRCGRADNLDKESRTTIAIAFLETIRNAGYEPMIYASTSFLNNQLNMSRLSNYQVWVAHYGVSQPTYRGAYQVWQYSSSGSVTGINGAVDMNYFYRRY